MAQGTPPGGGGGVRLEQTIRAKSNGLPSSLSPPLSPQTRLRPTSSCACYRHPLPLQFLCLLCRACPSSQPSCDEDSNTRSARCPSEMHCQNTARSMDRPERADSAELAMHGHGLNAIFDLDWRNWTFGFIAVCTTVMAEAATAEAEMEPANSKPDTDVAKMDNMADADGGEGDGGADATGPAPTHKTPATAKRAKAKVSCHHYRNSTLCCCCASCASAGGRQWRTATPAQCCGSSHGCMQHLGRARVCSAHLPVVTAEV